MNTLTFGLLLGSPHLAWIVALLVILRVIELGGLFCAAYHFGRLMHLAYWHLKERR